MRCTYYLNKFEYLSATSALVSEAVAVSVVPLKEEPNVVILGMTYLHLQLHYFYLPQSTFVFRDLLFS